MIKNVTKIHENQIKEFIKNDIYQNVYMYIDIELYGFNNQNIETNILINNDKIKLILFQYYNSLQLFKVDQLEKQDIIELVDYIDNKKFVMISGTSEVINKINNGLECNYKKTDGFVFSLKNIKKTNNKIAKLAKDEDYDQIVKLICSDENIGGHYNPDILKEQFIERNKNMNCKNIIIKDNNEIACHAATYANCDLISVIGGVITNKRYRNKGYGKQIVSELAEIIYSEGKIPVLYCYDPIIIEWYMNMGWTKINTSSKLELIKK